MTRSEQILLAKALYELRVRERNNPLKYFVPLNHPNINQKEFLECEKKNLLVLGGNRSGKTMLGAVKTLTYALNNPNSDIWVATWADMLIPVLMRTYYEMLPKSEVSYGEYSIKRGFTHRLIVLKNNSIIRFKTYEQGRESFQGASKDLIHLDEEAPQDIYLECKARLIDRNGIMIRTMTPLNGLTYTYDEIMSNSDTELVYWHWDTTFNPYISKDAFERIIGGYSEKEKIVRTKGHFVNLYQGLVYYSFSNSNLFEKEYNPKLPLEVGCDFNITLMSWIIVQEDEGIDYVIDYIELEDYANTDLLCKLLKDKYPNHQSGWIFYGDISGNQRHPESARTNWDIIQSNFPDAKLNYQFIKNIKDRIDIVNLRLEKQKLKIHPKCKRLIMDLNKVNWEMLLNKNKAGKLTHASDGLSYLINFKYSNFKPLTFYKGG